MDWTNQMVLEFLDEYEREPIIWNPKHPLHKNRNNLFDSWKNIESNFGKKYSLNITELKKKKDSIMASFRTHLNKVKQTMKSGAGSDDLYKPNWFAFDKMASFLRDKDSPRDTISSEDITRSQMESEELSDARNIENIGTDKTLTPTENITPNENDIPSNSNAAFKPPVLKRKKLSEAETLQRKKKSEVDTLQEKMDDAYSILGNIQKNARKRDVCDIYADLVAEKLRQMDEHTRDSAMNRIDNLLFDLKRNQTRHDPNQYYQNTSMFPNFLHVASPPYSQSGSTPSPRSTISSTAHSEVAQNEYGSGSQYPTNAINLASPQCAENDTDMPLPRNTLPLLHSNSHDLDCGNEKAPTSTLRQFYHTFE